MHYHLEVVLPPTDDIEGQIENVLHEFDEGNEEAYYAFWDWYVIGGRWTGAKIEAKCGPRLQEFKKLMDEMKVTVSAVQFGKLELQPTSQRKEVDRLWNEWFPDSRLEYCPLFKAPGNHNNDRGPGDIMTVSEVPKPCTAARVIIAGPGYDGPNFRVTDMWATELWNGSTNQDTTFSGDVHEAIKLHNDRLERAVDEYIAKHTVKDDWLCVTIDYHS